MAGGEEATAVAENGRTPRLVEGDPVLALGDGLEDDAGVVLKVEGELLTVQETTVALVESIGEIPVEEGDEGGDASLKEVVDELDVVVKAGLVDGVVATTDRDDSRPGKRKAVGVCAYGLEQGNVFGGAVVGIAGDGTGAAIGNLAGNGAEGVPDGGATAVLLGGTLDLVTVVVDK